MSKEKETDWPVRIATPRLLLREAHESDRERHIDMLTNPATRAYLGGAVDYASRQALELSPLGLTWGAWVIACEGSDEMIGTISLTYDRGELEVSFALLPQYVGYGYSSEAVRAIIDFATEELEEDVMIAVPQSSNKRAVAQLKSLGFSVRKGLSEFGSQQFLMERPLIRRTEP